MPGRYSQQQLKTMAKSCIEALASPDDQAKFYALVHRLSDKTGIGPRDVVRRIQHLAATGKH